MLEQLLIFTRGGLILWTCKELGNALRGSPIDTLIRSCLLEERSGASSYNYDAPGAAYTLKWTFHNELGLVFVAVYQRILHLLYVDDLLAMVKKEFSEIYDPKRTVYNDFDDKFRQLRKEAEARAEEMKNSNQVGLAKKQGKVQQTCLEGGNKKKSSGDSGNDGGDGEKSKGRKSENGLVNGNCVGNVEVTARGTVNGKENEGSMGGMGFGANSSNSRDNNGNGGLKLPYADLFVKYVSLPEGFKIFGVTEEGIVKKNKKGGLKLKVKIANPSLRRLVSGAIAGAVSRTAVAPLETIRTHLMVGSSGHSTTEVFNNIMQTEGWKGLFRGNLVNVIRVAPSKAIELFAYDTVNKNLSPKPGEQPKLPIPASLVAGACAGVSSTLITYPLELVKTRLTIQKDAYDGLLDAFVKILQEGGPRELYRGLTPSLVGVIPYAATNYFAYDTLRKAYRKIFKQEKIGNIETLLIGSVAGAISSSATFPLEVARKHMQVGAVSGRQVYNNVLHALASILEQEGIQGLYKGLGPSCMKLVPAAGISFMCYEACKRILVEIDDDA